MPSDVDLLAPAVVANPHPAFARLREEDPVHWSKRHRAWVLTRYDDVAAFFRDSRLSSDRASPLARGGRDEAGGEDPVVSVLSRWMVFRDPPDHTRMRRAPRPRGTDRAGDLPRRTSQAAPGPAGRRPRRSARRATRGRRAHRGGGDGQRCPAPVRRPRDHYRAAGQRAGGFARTSRAAGPAA